MALWYSHILDVIVRYSLCLMTFVTPLIEVDCILGSSLGLEWYICLIKCHVDTVSYIVSRLKSACQGVPKYAKMFEDINVIEHLGMK